MTNAERMAVLRYCGNSRKTGCKGCPLWDKPVDACFQIVTAAADALEAADKRIAELEAQLPKEGEWIEDDTTYCGADLANYKCSLCGKIGGTWRRGLKQDELPPFCGSCGARMDGERKDNETKLKGE